MTDVHSGTALTRGAVEGVTLALALRDLSLVIRQQVAAALLCLRGDDYVLRLRVLIHPAPLAPLPDARPQLMGNRSTVSCSRRGSCSALPTLRPCQGCCSACICTLGISCWIDACAWCLCLRWERIGACCDPFLRHLPGCLVGSYKVDRLSPN